MKFLPSGSSLLAPLPKGFAAQDEAADAEGDDNEEPEEQEGSWVITPARLVGDRLDRSQLAAQAVDAAMKPTQVMAVWTVCMSASQHVEHAPFAVQARVPPPAACAPLSMAPPHPEPPWLARLGSRRRAR